MDQIKLSQHKRAIYEANGTFTSNNGKEAVLLSPESEKSNSGHYTGIDGNSTYLADDETSCDSKHTLKTHRLLSVDGHGSIHLSTSHFDSTVSSGLLSNDELFSNASNLKRITSAMRRRLKKTTSEQKLKSIYGSASLIKGNFAEAVALLLEKKYIKQNKLTAKGLVENVSAKKIQRVRNIIFIISFNPDNNFCEAYPSIRRCQSLQYMISTLLNDYSVRNFY